MAEKVLEGGTDKTSEDDQGKWTQVKVIGEYQQYFIKRLLKLDPWLLQQMVAKKVIAKKLKSAVEVSEYDMDYFIAVLKKRNVAKFVKFLEVLEASFSWNKNHRTLVSTMSEHLLLMSNVNEEEKVIIERVIHNAQQIGSECEEILPGQTVSGVVGKTVTESETHTQIPGETKPGSQSYSLVDVKDPQKTLYTQQTHKQGVFGTEKTEPETCTPTVEGVEKTTRVSETNIAESDTVKSLPRGFIEPRHVEFLSRERLVNDVWTFHSTEHGVTVSIHKDAVPSNIDTFALKMHAYLSGMFEIPDGYEICTAIFVLQVYPKFEFTKPVNLKMPHSVLFDEDDQPEDFVILRAPEPDSPVQSDIHTSKPSSSPQDTDTTTLSCSKSQLDASVQPVYKFSDIISDADYSEDYYVMVDLKHFCAVVGAKRRRKYRQSKHSSSLSLSRQGSLNKQRRRSRRNVMKRRLKMIQKGDSVGSSRHSSYDGSFDKPSPLLRQQCSSTESDGPFPRQLHRQVAIHRDDDNFSSKSAANPLLQQTSSTDEDASCNEICIVCCSPVKCTTNWTTRFMVARNIPTGRKALYDAVKDFERRSCVSMESVSRVAFPYNYFIGFEPNKWKNSDWIVNSTTIPQIHLDLVYCDFIQGQPQFVDFDAESRNRLVSSPLHQEITVTGAATKSDGKHVYFTIKSTEKPVPYSRDVLYTKSWLYPENSQLLQALNSGNDKDSNSLYLKPYQPDDQRESNTDHCKQLIADITLQLPCTLCDLLLECLELSDIEKSYLKSEENRRMYVQGSYHMDTQ